MPELTAIIPASAIVIDTAQRKGWDTSLQLSSDFQVGQEERWLRRLWWYGDIAGGRMRLGFDADGATEPLNAGGQDLPAAWETYARAVGLEQGNASIDIAGPDHEGNAIRDAAEFYVWSPATAESAALGAFFAALDTTSDLTVKLRIDTSPSFGAATIADVAAVQGRAIADLVLPEASGGNGALTYSLAPAVPGLTFDAATRTLSGTPTAAGTTAMAYMVTDGDGDGDFDAMTFDVVVAEAVVPLAPNAMTRYLDSLNLPYPETARVRWGMLRAAARVMQAAADAVVAAMREWWPLTASEDGLATLARQLGVPRQAGESLEDWRQRVAREPAARRLWGRRGAVSAALDAISEDYDTWEFPRDGLRLDVDELDGDKRLDEGPAVLIWPSSPGSLSADKAAEMRAYLGRTLAPDIDVRVSTDLPLR